MKKYILLIVFCLFNSSFSSEKIPDYLRYIDPIPGAKYVCAGTSIIIRPINISDIDSFHKKYNIIVKGSISGIHECKFKISDDNITLLYQPVTRFFPGENVTVSFFDNYNKHRDREIFLYTFDISKEIVSSNYSPNNNQYPLIGELGSIEADRFGIYNPSPLTEGGFPDIVISNSNEPSNGYLFLSDFAGNPSINVGPYLLILDNQAHNYFSRVMDGSCFDFKLQPNGYLTYYMGTKQKYFEIDSLYNTIDSFYCGNHYSTDLHELQILSNGHALLMSYDTETVDMRPIVAGGNPNARVAGLIIQEIDRDKDVVFQWRSWDYYKITDATHEDLTAARIDYVHGNAIELDRDGNILISCRHMDEITKINRYTGAMIWRFGGKNNQFNFVNDPIGFSHQHAIRRIANGNVTLFDNGNYHTPHFSRAVEYSLNEFNKTATLVWQYRNNPDIYGGAMGYVQRLDNGNTLIGWGLTNPSATEVKYDGTKAYEISLPNQVYSYRAYRFDWKEKTASETIIPASYKLGQNYPNPFNPSTSIVFEILKESNVHLKVYDALGRQITELINSNLQPGTYTSVWNAQGFASGIYFYKIIAGDFIETKKMMLVK